MNVNITSKAGNYDFKIDSYHVKQFDSYHVKQWDMTKIWECLQIYFELGTNKKKLKGVYRRSVYVDPQSSMKNVVSLP